jgi:hypothetical protein
VRIIIYRRRILTALIIIICFVLFDFIKILLSPIYNFLNTSTNDPTNAGFIGAVIGGVFSLLATLYTHKNQIKVKGIIIRKNVIYSPLYDELKKFKRKILKEELEYPTNFSLKIDQTLYRRDGARFEAWERISNDVRFIEVPTYLSKEFINLSHIGEKYKTSYKELSLKIKRQLRDRLKDDKRFERLSRESENQGTDFEIIDNLLSNKTVPDKLIKYEVTWGSELDNEGLEIAKTAFEELDISFEINKVKEEYRIFLNKIDDITNALEILISYIQKRYEHRNRYY